MIKTKYELRDVVYFTDINVDSIAKKELQLVVVRCVITAIEVNLDETGETVRYWLSPLGNLKTDFIADYYEEQYVMKDVDEVQALTSNFINGVR